MVQFFLTSSGSTYPPTWPGLPPLNLFAPTIVAVLLAALLHRSHQGFLSGGLNGGGPNNGNQLVNQGSPPHTLMAALQEGGGFRVSGPYQISTPFQMGPGSFPGSTPFQGGQGGGYHANGNSDGNGGGANNFGDSGGFQNHGSNFPRNGDNFQGPRGFQGQANFQGPGNYQGQRTFHGPTGFQGQSSFQGQSTFQGQSGYQAQNGFGGGQGNFPSPQGGLQDSSGGPLNGQRSQFVPSPRAPDTPHVSIQPASVKVVYVPVVSTSIKASSLSKLTGEHAHGKDGANSYFTGSGQSGASQQEVSKPSSYAAGVGSYRAKATDTGKTQSHTSGGHATIPIIIIQKEHHHSAKGPQAATASFPGPTSHVPQSQRGGGGGSAVEGGFSSKQSYGFNNRVPTPTQQQPQQPQHQGYQEPRQRPEQGGLQVHNHHQQRVQQHQHQQVSQQEKHHHHQNQEHHQQQHHHHQQQVSSQRPADLGHESSVRNNHGGAGAVIPVIIIQKTLQAPGRQQHQHQHQSGGYNVPAAPPPVRGPTAWSPWR